MRRSLAVLSSYGTSSGESSSEHAEAVYPYLRGDRLSVLANKDPAFDSALGAPGQTPGWGARIPVIPLLLRGAHIPTPPSLQADNEGLGCKGVAG